MPNENGKINNGVVVKMGRGSSGAGGGGGFNPDNKKLEGSEKQVAWARDILNEGYGTINRNIEWFNSMDGFDREVRILREMKKDYEVNADRITTAKFVIDKRSALNGRAMSSMFNNLFAYAQRNGIDETIKQMRKARKQGIGQR